MWRRTRLAVALAAAATVSLVTTPSMARAAPADSSAAPGCSVTALTDVVDHTSDVSGGGSVHCTGAPSPVYGFFITVTLFRDGIRVAADSAVCPSGTSGCSAAVQVTDSWAGSQRWQVFVQARDRHNEDKWGNNLYH